MYTEHRSLFSFSIILIVFALTAVTNTYEYDSRSGYDLKFENEVREDTISTNITAKSGEQLCLQVQPADFTDYSFASREPVGDWIAVARQGCTFISFRY